MYFPYNDYDFIILGTLKLVIGVVEYSNACQRCDAAYNREEYEKKNE